MRIGIDARMYGSFSTGIGNYTKHCIEELQKIDSENEYVIFLDEIGFLEYQGAKNFKKVLAPYLYNSLGEQFLFVKMLYAAKLDLMHFTSFHNPILYRKKSIVTLHDLTLSLYPWRKLTKSRQRFTYKKIISSIVGRAKKIITLSALTKKDAIELLWAHEEKIEIIYSGVDEKRFKKEVSSLEIKQSKESLGIYFEEYFFSSGSFREYKNLVRLIDAFFLITKENPKIWLVLSWKEDPSYHDVRDTIVRLGLQDRIKLVGFVDDTTYLRLLHGAKWYIFPSLYEGFGLPVLEAMTAGIPVACSRGSSFKEIIGEENALFFSPLHFDDITTKMRTILTDETLVKKLVENGRKQVAKYNWEASVRKLHKVYLES